MKTMKRVFENRPIKTYQYNSDYYVDITAFAGKTPDENDVREAWLYHKDYGVKMLMFGCPAKQTYGYQEYDAFLAMVEANVEDYIKLYQESYEDKDEED